MATGKIIPEIATRFKDGKIIPQTPAISHPQITPNKPYDGRVAVVKNLKLKGTGFEKKEEVIIFPETMTNEDGLGIMVEVLKINAETPELIPAPLNIFKTKKN